MLLYHARPDRRDRSLQANQRTCRQRADALRQERMAARCQGRIREVRGLQPTAGIRLLARGRKADTRRASGMGGDLRPGHRCGSAAKRRSRLVGAAAARLDSDLAEEPQRRSRHSRSSRVHRHVVHEPPVPAIQRHEGAPRDPASHEPGRLHACLCRGRHGLVEADARVLRSRLAALQRRGGRNP